MKVLSVTVQTEKGEIITMTPEGSQVQPGIDIEYADDGWSVEMRHGCLVRNQLVDQHLAAMRQGDKYQAEVAENAQPWFGNFIDGREYDDETRQLLIRNYQQDNASPTFTSGWLGMTMFEQFYLTIRKDESDKKSPFTYFYEDEIEDAVTAIRGFSPFAAHKKIAAEYINILNRRAKSLKFHAENPNTPQPSPMKSGR